MMKIVSKCMVCMNDTLVDAPDDTQIPEGSELSPEGFPKVGYTMCQVHSDAYGMGYVAAVEVDMETVPNGNYGLEELPRTGRILHVHYDYLSDRIQEAVTTQSGYRSPLMFVGRVQYAEIEAIFEYQSVDKSKLN